MKNKKHLYGAAGIIAMSIFMSFYIFLGTPFWLPANSDEKHCANLGMWFWEWDGPECREKLAIVKDPEAFDKYVSDFLATERAKLEQEN